MIAVVDSVSAYTTVWALPTVWFGRCVSEVPTTGTNLPVVSIVCQATTPTWSSRVHGPFQISIASTCGKP